MRQVKPSQDVRLELLDKSPALVAHALNRYAAALLKGIPDAVSEARMGYVRTVGAAMAYADAVGGKRAIMELDHAAKKSGRPPVLFSARAFSQQRISETAYFADPPAFPSKAFVEAFEELLAREPRIARTAAEIQKVYAEGGFALLRISEKAQDFLTKKIQEKIAEMGAAGVTETPAKRILAEMAGITEAYAQVVFRTNLARSFTDGRKRQMESPEAQAIAPAFEYTTAGDVDVRPNHKAAEGLIAPIGHALFDRISPPLGYNCLEPGQVVKTMEGWRNIEQVRVDDFVLTHKGRYRKVVSIHRNSFSGNLIGIRVGRNKLFLTPNHKILVNGRWRSADQLRVDDEIAQIRNVGGGRGYRAIHDVRQSNSSRPQKHVSSETSFSSPSVMTSLYSEPKLGTPQIYPERLDVMLMDGFYPHFREDLHQSFFDFGGKRICVRMRKRIPSVILNSRFDRFVYDFSSEKGGSLSKFFPDSIPPRFVIGPSEFAGIALRPDWNLVMNQEVSDDSGILRSKDHAYVFTGFQFPDVPFFKGVSKGSRDAGLESPDDSWVHGIPPYICMGRIISISGKKYNGIVCNLSVEEDQSYVSEIGVLSNCRCDQRIVDIFELRARNLLDRAGRPKVYYPPNFRNAGPDPGFR